MSEYFALELTRANAQPLVCDTFAVILVLARGLHCVAEFVRAHVDPAAAQRAQHPLVSSAQLRPLGVDLHPAGREVSALPDENADLEEGRMAVDAHAVRVDLAVVLSVSPIVGGRQQFSCRCCGRDMAHWNPPRRKTPHEASMGLERYGVLGEKSDFG